MSISAELSWAIGAAASVGVIKPPSGASIDQRVWDIPIFSERTAQGFLLRFTTIKSVVQTEDGPVAYEKRTLALVEDIPAAQVEGPMSLKRAIDRVFGFLDIDQDAYSGGIYTTADDENAGFDREYNLDATSTVILSPFGIPSSGQLTPEFVAGRTVTIPIDQFTGFFSVGFRDNRNGTRLGSIEFEFIRGDGSVIDSFRCWMKYRVAVNYKQTGPPYTTREAWVSNPEYGEVKFEAQAFNVNFGDGGNAFYVVRPPVGTQRVRVINWSYAYPRTEADLAAGLVETTFPYTYPVQSRARIFVSMHERTLDLTVEQYDQLQSWETTGRRPDYLSRQTFRVGTLLGADWLHDEAATVPSLRQQPVDIVTADGPALPRNGVFRVPGGYLHLHGEIGRASKHYFYPDEVSG